MKTPSTDLDPDNWSNASRVEVARQALFGFAGADTEDVETNLIDLLANLLHFCKAEGIDFSDKLRIAEIHFEEEQAEELHRFPQVSCDCTNEKVCFECEPRFRGGDLAEGEQADPLHAKQETAYRIAAAHVGQFVSLLYFVRKYGAHIPEFQEPLRQCEGIDLSWAEEDEPSVGGGGLNG